jgi:thioredoxin-like negative regulator of GroEL
VEVVERVVYAEEEIEDLGPAAGPAPAPGADPKVADPRPAAASPATEKFLREASEEFRAKRYYEAAVKFRLAALADPEQPGPLFALGQSLIAMGEDAYAARVLRKAIALEPRMLGETGDLVGVWESRAEFDRVLAALEARAAAAPADGDARFLLAVERYFTGDPRCREDLEALHAAHPKDGAVALLRGAVGSRFKAPDDLPAIPGAPAK